MSSLALRAQNISKQYHIGFGQKTYDRLSDQILDLLREPISRVGKVLRGDAAGIAGLDETIWALKDISFEINHGEVVGIIGRNGAGKSTLLKILSRITEPTTGRAEVFGRIGSLLEVGTGFHPELTGRENVFLNGSILGMRKKEIEQRFDEIVDFAEIDKFINTPVKHYSSGMYVRLAFSVAAHLETEILLIDEVLAVGDIEFQRKCLGKMDNIAQQGRTVLFVSHNLGLMQSLCQRGILIHEGTITRNGTIMEAIDQYLQSIDPSVKESLVDRNDRRGVGKAHVVHIDIQDKNGRSTSILQAGQPARFEFEVNRLLPNSKITFNIFDHMGQPVAQFASFLNAPQDKVDPYLQNKFICEFDELMLLPERYRVDVWLTGDNALQDGIQSAIVFDVADGIVDGRPARATRLFRVVFPHRWIIPAKNIN